MTDSIINNNEAPVTAHVEEIEEAVPSPEEIKIKIVDSMKVQLALCQIDIKKTSTISTVNALKILKTYVQCPAAFEKLLSEIPTTCAGKKEFEQYKKIFLTIERVMIDNLIPIPQCPIRNFSIVSRILSLIQDEFEKRYPQKETPSIAYHLASLFCVTANRYPLKAGVSGSVVSLPLF